MQGKGSPDGLRPKQAPVLSLQFCKFPALLPGVGTDPILLGGQLSLQP